MGRPGHPAINKGARGELKDVSQDQNTKGLICHQRGLDFILKMMMRSH